jgi:hypothetical protein
MSRVRFALEQEQGAGISARPFSPCTIATPRSVRAPPSHRFNLKLFTLPPSRVTGPLQSITPWCMIDDSRLGTHMPIRCRSLVEFASPPSNVSFPGTSIPPHQITVDPSRITCTTTPPWSLSRDSQKRGWFGRRKVRYVQRYEVEWVFADIPLWIRSTPLKCDGNGSTIVLVGNKVPRPSPLSGYI